MARDFNGTTDKLLSTAGSALSGPPATMAAWVRPDSTATERNIAGCSNSASSNDLFRIEMQGGLANIQYRGVGNLLQKSAAGALSTTAWTHIAGTFLHNGTDRIVEIFKDGASGGTATSAASSASITLNQTEIGVLQRNSAAQFWDGVIAEVAMWSAVLSAVEIAALADGVSPLLIRPDALVGYWPVMGRTSPEIDLLGALPMTVTGTAQAAHPPMLYAGRVHVVRASAGVGGVVSSFAAKTGGVLQGSSRKSSEQLMAATAGVSASGSASKRIALGLSMIAGAIGTVSGKKAASAGISAISGLLGALETAIPGTAEFNAITGALVSVTHSTARLSTIQAKMGANTSVAGIHRATRALQAIAGAVAAIQGPPDDNRASSFAAIAGAAAALSKQTARIAQLAAKTSALGADVAKSIRSAQLAAVGGLRAAIQAINPETTGALLTVTVSARAAYSCEISARAAYRCNLSEAIVH